MSNFKSTIAARIVGIWIAVLAFGLVIAACGGLSDHFTVVVTDGNVSIPLSCQHNTGDAYTCTGHFGGTSVSSPEVIKENGDGIDVSDGSGNGHCAKTDSDTFTCQAKDWNQAWKQSSFKEGGDQLAPGVPSYACQPGDVMAKENGLVVMCWPHNECANLVPIVFPDIASCQADPYTPTSDSDGNNGNCKPVGEGENHNENNHGAGDKKTCSESTTSSTSTSSSSTKSGSSSTSSTNSSSSTTTSSATSTSPQSQAGGSVSPHVSVPFTGAGSPDWWGYVLIFVGAAIVGYVGRNYIKNTRR